MKRVLPSGGIFVCWFLLLVKLIPFLVLCAPAACSNTNAMEDHENIDEQHRMAVVPDDNEIVTAWNSLGLRLFSRLVAVDRENVLICPVSIASALAMVAAGSTPSSVCAAELDGVLGLPLSSSDRHARAAQQLLQGVAASDPGVSLLIANSAWLRSSIRPDFSQRVQDIFQAEAKPLPQQPQPINSWVSEKTEGLIPKIIDDIDPLVIAVLVNAVYFKGQWKYPFDTNQTKEMDFHLQSGEIVPCQMMSQRFVDAKKLRYGEVEYSVESGPPVQAQVVVLPYGDNNRFEAAIVIPRNKDPSHMGPEKGDEVLSTLAEALGQENQDGGGGGGGGGAFLWQRWMTGLKKTKATVFLPRLRLEYGVRELSPALGELGLLEPFSQQADVGPNGELQGKFLRMTEDPLAYLSAVLHKTVIEINEEGTTAAAVTGAVMMTRAIDFDPPVEIKVDRPFLFVLQDRETGLVLFVGKIDNPNFQ